MSEAAVAPAVGGDVGSITPASGAGDVVPGVAAAAAATIPAAPAAPAVTPSVTPAVAPTPWTDSLSAEQKEYVTNKGFVDPASVLESYVNLEKLRGVPQDRLLKLPDVADSPEWKDVYSKLGKPESAEGYGIKSEGENAAFADWARDAFFDVNLSVDQSKALLEKFAEFGNSKQLDMGETYKSEIAAQELSLKKEWGSAYHQNIAIAQRAAQTFGVPSEAIDAMEKAVGFDGVMKMMNNIGSRLGESNFVSGGQQAGFGETAVLTPQQAQARLQSLKKDPDFTSKYLAGDAEAKNKMSRLHQMAFPTD